MTKLHVSTTINGEPEEFLCEYDETMLDALRNRLGLTGSKEGCSSGDCGACSVTLNGRLVCACLMLAVQADGEKIVTIEGLSNDQALTPLQAAFRKNHALQCGFCTPGMITTAHALLTKEPQADAKRVREVLSGNICRCTGYISIIEAVLEARAAYSDREPAP